MIVYDECCFEDPYSRVVWRQRHSEDKEWMSGCDMVISHSTGLLKDILTTRCLGTWLQEVTEACERGINFRS
jgi:hypothetical protein